MLVKDLATMDTMHDITDDLVSMTTNKAYGRCSGTWQIMLTYSSKDLLKKGHESYYNALAPDQAVTIEMDAGDGAGYFPVMFGLIDRVSIVTQGQQRQVKVSGQDLGKLLAKHNIGWNPTAAEMNLPDLEGNKKAWVTYQRLYGLQVGTAKRLVEQVLMLMYSDMPIAQSTIKPVITTTDTWQIWQSAVLNITQQSTWDTMKMCAHEPFNVLHCDTSKTDVNKFELILEEQPIDTTGKLTRNDASRVHTIGETDIVMSDVGISDAERVNLLTYWPAIYSENITQSGLQIAMGHPDLTSISTDDDNSMQLHGWNAKVEQDHFANQQYNRQEAPSELDSVKANQQKLWNWRKDNHKLESGTIQVHLRPDIRTGSCLLVRQGNTDDYKEYLIEQVSHQCVWHPMPQFVTTLHVTRGQSAPPVKTELAAPPKRIQ